MNTFTALLVFLGIGIIISKRETLYITNTNAEDTSSTYAVNTTTISGLKK